MARRLSPSPGGLVPATRRPLKIFAADPMLGKTFGNRARIDVINEALQAGPVGARLAVVDYDGAQRTYYKAVDLDDPVVLLQGGLEPSEADPRFHQQMVYAVASRTLENFDRALGRTLRLSARAGRGREGQPRLRLLPHAFYGANAFYTPELNAILFGYFKAEAEDVGQNLPGQIVFTCLSHDVIAHEMTHAIVDRLRPLFLEPSNLDVLAFHEGFADIVALLQHFSFPDILREQIQRQGVEIRKPSSLVQLAQQFGYATGAGAALRSALDKPGNRLSDAIDEPHERGSILVAAVFDGFFKTYQRRIADLVRIATGGTGNLPTGELHPDLANRIAAEATKTAQRVLDMCIRAFDYLPPVDVTFGDFLRAMITADFELVPQDEFDCRGAMIEAFRMRAIYPDGVASLAEESLLWENVESRLPMLGAELQGLIGQAFVQTVRAIDAPLGATSPDDAPDAHTEFSQEDAGEAFDIDVSKELAVALHRYATANATMLGLSLDPDYKIQVRGFHPVFRVAPNGRLLVELVAQFAQVDRRLGEELGGVPFRGGCTLIASSDGRCRYLVKKPMLKSGGKDELAALARLTRQRHFVERCDMRNAMTPYYTKTESARRIAAMANFANLHGG
ncbi:hypothetical protein [Mitsuaria sp. GD03876]|uniref:hypothetical protein n=1 Tax=Mitsuaria sp. GD03876 TaxID=2975399 RepID=UPI00244BAD13|nr:hypothetical protein [Mitsuaria sp. GD03876]MDH0867270.1 hypothetical protein [Mitsuaria sp. GD03876]